MLQQGQVFKLMSRDADGGALWAYRYRTGGRESERVQRGGFASEGNARAALEQGLEKLRRADGTAKVLTLAELVEQYLAQHEAAPVTLEKLRWLLVKAVAAFGDHGLVELRPADIAAWRMTIPAGYRFEATQALGQVLARAVVWGMLEAKMTGTLRDYRGRGLALLAKRPTLVNAAKRGVELVSTENDETNGPMLRVNENLGYRPIGSTLRWSRP